MTVRMFYVMGSPIAERKNPAPTAAGRSREAFGELRGRFDGESGPGRAGVCVGDAVCT